MMITRSFLGPCLLLWFAVAQNAHAQEAYERAGKIYFRDSNGAEKNLTSAGRDSSPSLSPDGSEIVFRRELKAPTRDDEGVYELRTIQTATNQEQVLLQQTQISRELSPFGPPAPFDTPQYSRDGKFVYFLIREAQTSSRIMRVNRRTRVVDVLVPGAVEFKVVLRGRYSGDIVVCQRRAALFDDLFNPTYWYYLFNSDGKEVGFIGREAKDMQRFLELPAK
jgi:hypothetical protein